MPSESEASKTSTDAPVTHPEPSPKLTNERSDISEPVSQNETASEAMEKLNLEGRATESTNEAVDSAPVEEQSVAADTTSMESFSLPACTPCDDVAASGNTDQDPHSPSTEAQPETMITTGDEKEASKTEPSTTLLNQPDEAKDKSAGEDVDASSQPRSSDAQSETEVSSDDEAQSQGFETDMEMFLQMETNREMIQQMHDDDRGDGVMVEGSSGLDAAEGEEEHSENGKGQDDPGTEQSPLSHAPEPLDFGQPQSQELQHETDDVSQTTAELAGGELNGLRSRRPSANNLTVAVDRQTSPAMATTNDSHSRTARDLLLQKGHLLGADSRLSRTMTSVANYIDGVGGKPSSEELAELDEFRAYTAQRARLMEEVLDGGGGDEEEEEEDPLAAMRRFDERWQDRAMDDTEGWGATRQDLRLAAVRAALHFRHEFGSIQSELAIMYFEHRVAGLRRRNGAELDDPIALQTLDILGSSAAAGDR